MNSNACTLIGRQKSGGRQKTHEHLRQHFYRYIRVLAGIKVYVVGCDYSTVIADPCCRAHTAVAAQLYIDLLCKVRYRRVQCMLPHAETPAARALPLSLPKMPRRII